MNPRNLYASMLPRLSTEEMTRRRTVDTTAFHRYPAARMKPALIFSSTVVRQFCIWYLIGCATLC